MIRPDDDVFEDQREEFPTDEMLQNWREANDYMNEGEECEPEEDE